MTLSIRAKAPDGDESQLYAYPLLNEAAGEMSDNLRFAAAVAEVGMLLRDSEWKGQRQLRLPRSICCAPCKSVSGDPYKEEFVYLVNLLDRAN